MKNQPNSMIGITESLRLGWTFYCWPIRRNYPFDNNIHIGYLGPRKSLFPSLGGAQKTILANSDVYSTQLEGATIYLAHSHGNIKNKNIVFYYYPRTQKCGDVPIDDLFCQLHVLSHNGQIAIIPVECCMMFDNKDDYYNLYVPWNAAERYIKFICDTWSYRSFVCRCDFPQVVYTKNQVPPDYIFVSKLVCSIKELRTVLLAAEQRLME